MKKFTKTLSIVLLIAMCVSMFTVSAFAGAPGTTCGYQGCDGTVSSTASDGKAATCTEDGYVAHFKCDKCTACYDSQGVQYTAATFYTKADITNPDVHNWVMVDATASTCSVAGTDTHAECSDCGAIKYKGVVYTSAADVDMSLALANHEAGTRVDAVAPTCTESGMEAYYLCKNCNATVDNNGVAFTPSVVAATGHTPNAAGVCTVCKEVDTSVVAAAEIIATNGNSSTKHTFSTTNKNAFGYRLKNCDVYEVVGVSVDGSDLVRGASGYSYDSVSGSINVEWSAINGLIGNELYLDVVFTVKLTGTTYTSEVGGFTIVNATENTSGAVGELYIGSLQNNRYVKDGTQKVLPWFKVGSDKVEVYLVNSGLYANPVPAEGTFGTGSDGKVTFTFKKSQLDELYEGYYNVKLYANGNMLDATPGMLQIAESGSNLSDYSLIFCNNNVETTGPYKYKSGDERPMLKSGMFTMNETLQYSSDIHSSWRNVGVHNYYVEQNGGKDSAYAYLGTSFLDSLNPGETYYFRVVVAAKDLGRNTDLVSSYVTLETGNNLKAVDTNKHVINSSKNLKFVCSDVIEKVYVGGQDLSVTDPDAFRLSNDGKYVTLYADFLNDRTAGSTYTLSVLTKSGEKLSTTFQILTTAQASASPRTGDDSNIALWSAFLLLSGAAVVAVLPRLKKHF